MATIVDVVFVGTGTSGAVPNVSCLTDPKQKCKVCTSAMTPEGQKNMKKNTSMIVRYRKNDEPNGRLRTVLIDCGKTFYDSALHIFPKYGIRELDGVILTHGHADACYGMDGLRQWTLGGAVQKSIDIYLNDETMEVVQRTFPFLVDVRFATGGGDVATFNYKIISPDIPFTIHGLEFMPLPVHHGTYLSTGEPYWCYGFKMNDISYISDTNYIPEETMNRIVSTPNRVFVIDCLRMEVTHASHFALLDSLDAARKVKALKTYLVGSTHRVDHYQLEKSLKSLTETEGLQVAPAYDALQIVFNEDNTLIEQSYIDPKPRIVRP
ncbi:hypothetical protein INT45_013082 [Circinella minor]|uniref:Metallo-beta-lactamase domain-containing protein n=1 Tax=Circinella minor TaxID=1195481 RepID=A0A8H7VJ62_9FUNG|nr:hypothetical protein INT45_013082 [Circinella minor]